MLHSLCSFHHFFFSTVFSFFFFFNDTATTEIYTLSLHDALRSRPGLHRHHRHRPVGQHQPGRQFPVGVRARSEEHTSELQSHSDLVCRLLLEKKKKNKQQTNKTNTKISK